MKFLNEFNEVSTRLLQEEGVNILLLIVGLFIGIFLLMYWSTVEFKWICDECGQEFEITLKQNVFGVNAGVNYKSLYCPKCQKKTMCKGIKK